MKPIFKQAYFMTRDSDDYVCLHANKPHLQVVTTEDFREDDESTVIEWTWHSEGESPRSLGFDNEGKFPVSQEQPLKVEMELWTSEI